METAQRRFDPWLPESKDVFGSLRAWIAVCTQSADQPGVAVQCLFVASTRWQEQDASFFLDDSESALGLVETLKSVEYREDFRLGATLSYQRDSQGQWGRRAPK